MKKNQILQNLRAADPTTLRRMIREERTRLLELRIQHRLAPLKNVRQIRQSRRAIARAETILKTTLWHKN